jgi:serine/threonine protein kinase
MEQSVESICNDLIRDHLFSTAEMAGLLERWLREGKEAIEDVDAFGRWVVANNYLTQYQLGFVLRGHGAQLFLNDYKIIERIGRGRMAGVYRAVHSLGQTVAIKILPPSKARDPQVLPRFQREARLALRLQHPNIVRSFQTGEKEGIHFLVMEHLEGETLEEVLLRRRLKPAEAVRLMNQALLGLQHIHEQGLVHRDIKPGNFMLIGSQPDSTQSATLKILDIGMGRALFEEGAPTAGNFDLTNEDSLLGTAEYMAPEQARDPHGADIRADIYGVGCVLYHALTGQPPFTDANRVRQLLRHATEEPRPVKELNPEVPDGLQQILNWMLAKDPARRYPTPDRAAQALQVFQVAGDEPAPDKNTNMKNYLNWLASQAGAAETTTFPPPPAKPEVGQPPTTVEPVPLVLPTPPPATRSAPAPAQPTRQRASAPSTSRPALPKTRPAKLDRAKEKEQVIDLTEDDLVPEPPADVDVELVPVKKPRKPPRDEVDEVEPSSSHRELIWLGIGFGVLGLLLGGIGVIWLIVRSSGRRDNEPPTNPADE